MAEATTFEKVDKLVEQYYKDKKAQKDNLKGVDLKTILTIAKPVLLLIAKTPIIPSKWREVIKDLVAILDVIPTKA